MNINDCYNFEDFRKLAKKKLPAPIFHYIDGGADDEITLNFKDSSSPVTATEESNPNLIYVLMPMRV